MGEEDEHLIICAQLPATDALQRQCKTVMAALHDGDRGQMVQTVMAARAPTA
jgi:hypothetical protein